MKLKALFRIYLISVGIALLLTGVLALIMEVIPPNTISEKLRNVYMGVIGAISVGIGLLYELRYKSFSYRPYNIAIIGFPKSGKTTLITTLFQQIFKQKISGLKATLKGESTIEKINELIEKKESGLPVGPTNDQTMFAYRTEVEIGRSSFSKEFYRVEFGDYPGEESDKLAESSYFDVLKKSDFFKWCIEANAYIFIIDVAKFVMASANEDNLKTFIASTSKAIRQSWQHFIDYNSNRSSIRKKPVLLVFNKMDVCRLNIYKNVIENDIIVEVQNIAYSTKKNPDINELNKDAYSVIKNTLLFEFSDIISYLKSEVYQFNILFTSSFGTLNGDFPDIEKILKLIFPKKALL